MEGGSFISRVEGTGTARTPHLWILPLIAGKWVTVFVSLGVGGSFVIRVPGSEEVIAPRSVMASSVSFNVLVAGDDVLGISPLVEFTGGEDALEVPYTMGFTVSRYPE